MIFLLGNVIFASCFGLCIKWVGNRQREDITTVGMINYVAAAAISLLEFAQIDAVQITVPAVTAGATMGLCYFIAFFFCVYAIRWIGVANSTVVSILSMLLPIFCGVFIWHENPNHFQMAGIGLALVSLFMIGGKGDQISQQPIGAKPWLTAWIIIGFFLLCGLSRLAQEAFKHECAAAERPTFLTAAFVLAAIPSLFLMIWRKQPITASEWVFGFCLGAANIFQTHFILKSLSQFDGFIVFPVTSAGSLILVTLVATQFLGEKLGRLTYIGIAIACVSLVFLNWM